jgi:uncharacterized protein (TIGR03545 family)
MSTENKSEKNAKKKGPIRFEAIIPVTILSVITYVYFSYYFDSHLKKLFEYVGTQANGAEVNVASVRTSFLSGSFDLNGLQVTDKEKPTQNSLEIENIHFQYLWDALLRMKFVVEDASINDIQLFKPRTRAGYVLPPEPAKPSKLTQIQDQVFSQVKDRYNKNMLGDAVTLLQGGDYKEQLQNIRMDLKSETRVQAMLSDVNNKKEFWDSKVKQLSDTSNLKSIEAQVNQIKAEKNFLKQAEGIKKLTDLLGKVQKQYKEIESSSKQLQSEVNAIAAYPKELEALVKQDIDSLKNRFSIPEIDFKDMAMHLFAGQFAEYIVKARKYQALAEQYIPEKKEKDELVPPKRAEGKNYHFPITKGYPLFWLKRAAISSKGTSNSYSGNVSGELTNVTTSPKAIGRPIKLQVKGDFPGIQISGVDAQLIADFTKEVGVQTADIKVASFGVPEKLFVDSNDLKLGFTNAIGSSQVKAKLIEDQIEMDWNTSFNSPKFLVESKTKLAQEMLSNILNPIPVVTVNGGVRGNFKSLSMNINSNLGDELGAGLKREIGNKIADAQNQIQSLIDEKINKPKEQLLNSLNLTKSNLNSFKDLENLYKQNEGQIKKTIEDLKSGKGKDLEDKAKKLFKGIKF